VRDPQSVITDAVNGKTKELASIYELSEPRLYQMLGENCCYPKAKRLIRAIAQVNPDGVRIIRADLESMFDYLIRGNEPGCVEELHKDAFEAVQASLENKPAAEQMRTLRELISAASRMLQSLEQPDFSPKKAVAQFRAKRSRA